MITRRLLLAAISPDSTALETIGCPAGARLDWDWLLERARAHKGAALLAARVNQQTWAVTLPDGVRGALDEILGWARQRAARARRTLQQLGRALRARAVPFLVLKVLKGSVLAERVYGDPALRPFSDVEVPVPPDRLADAEAALIGLGYRFYSPPLRTLGFVPSRVAAGAPGCAGIRTGGPGAVPDLSPSFRLPAAEGRRAPPVELHWHVAAPRNFPDGPALLWEHATPTVVAETSVQTLSLDATLVHVPFHAMRLRELLRHERAETPAAVSGALLGQGSLTR